MIMPRLDKLAYSVADLEALTPFGHSKIYEEIAAGRLIARKNGRQTYFLPEEVRAWLEAGPPIRSEATTGD